MPGIKVIYNRNMNKIHVTDTIKCKVKYKIPKSVLAFFLTSQLLCGFDFGFASMFKKKYRLIIKLFTLFLSTAMILIIVSPLTLNNIFYWWNVVEYLSYFVVLNLTKYKAYHYINDISMIYNFNNKEKKILSIIAVYYNIAGIFIKTILIGALCKAGYVSLFNEYHIIYTIIYYVPCLCVNIVPVVQIVLMYYTKCCAQYLKTLIGSEVNLGYVEKYYIGIANCYDKIKLLHGRLVSIFFFTY